MAHGEWCPSILTSRKRLLCRSTYSDHPINWWNPPLATRRTHLVGVSGWTVIFLKLGTVNINDRCRLWHLWGFDYIITDVIHKNWWYHYDTWLVGLLRQYTWYPLMKICFLNTGYLTLRSVYHTERPCGIPLIREIQWKFVTPAAYHGWLVNGSSRLNCTNLNANVNIWN
jgi:hypothetical protein